MRLHPDVEALLAAMKSLQLHLAVHSPFWADHVRQAADEVAQSDAHGVARFLDLFGGMGSLNDLVLHQNGNPLHAENSRLEALRTRAWNLAHALRHEAD